MGLFGFGKKSATFLTIVTAEGPGRLRLNGLKAKDKEAKKKAVGHDRTVCWIEFSNDGGVVDKGVGKTRLQAGEAEKLLRDLPANPICRSVLDRLREGQDSVGKWLQLGQTAGR